MLLRIRRSRQLSLYRRMLVPFPLSYFSRSSQSPTTPWPKRRTQMAAVRVRINELGMAMVAADNPQTSGWFATKLKCWVYEVPGSTSTTLEGLPQDCKSKTQSFDETWVSVRPPLTVTPEEAVEHHDKEGTTWLGAHWRLDQKGLIPQHATIEPWSEDNHRRGSREMEQKTSLHPRAALQDH